MSELSSTIAVLPQLPHLWAVGFDDTSSQSMQSIAVSTGMVSREGN